MEAGCIVLGSRGVKVEQEGRRIIFAGSSVVDREPRSDDVERQYRRAWSEQQTIQPPPKGKKWCSNCQHWIRFKGFSPDERNRDGLQSHCKECRRQHHNKLYALLREERLAAAR